MTLPRFLADGLAGLHAGDSYRLAGAEGRHAVTVRRIRAGEPLEVTDGRGTVARAVATGVDGAELLLELLSLTVEPAPSPSFVLVQALAKGGRDELAVESATELGVDAVQPWQAERSVSVWKGERAAKGWARWQATAREAAKQSRRSRVPQVREPVDTSGLVTALPGAALALVLSEEAELPVGEIRLPEAGEVWLVVGPEGGISPGELAALTAAGGRAVRLGPHVLRTSTAGPAAIAALSAPTRWH